MNENETKRVIEINGIKMEIDLRQAKRIDNFRVGDQVKVLVKEYDTYKSHAGAIVGFDEFQERPTIIVAYIKVDYSTAEIKYAYINAASNDIEIVKANEEDIPFKKASVIDMMQREINKKETELADSQHKLAHFNKWFGKYFEAKKEGAE